MIETNRTYKVEVAQGQTFMDQIQFLDEDNTPFDLRREHYTIAGIPTYLHTDWNPISRSRRRVRFVPRPAG